MQLSVEPPPGLQSALEQGMAQGGADARLGPGLLERLELLLQRLCSIVMLQ